MTDPIVDSGVDAEPGTRIVLGAYTPEMGGRATGLGSYRWNASDAEAVDLVAHPGLAMPSPTWVVADPAGRHVYAVSENPEPRLWAAALAGDGRLSALNDVAIDGAGACHVALTTDARHLVVANYGDGTIGSFPVNPDGTVGDQVGRYALDGSGPDPDRQDHAHAHQVVADGDHFWVVDLGGDAVHRFHLDAAGGIVADEVVVRLPPGSGPRHLVLVDDLMVVACELSAEVWVGRREDAGEQAGTYSEIGRTASTTRDRDLADHRVYPSGIGVRIAPEGREVLVANRGCDTVAVFRLGEAGHLDLSEEFPVPPWPRDLKVHGDRAWVASQTDDRVTSHVRTAHGSWIDDFEFPTPSPACVVVVPPAGA